MNWSVINRLGLEETDYPYQDETIVFWQHPKNDLLFGKLKDGTVLCLTQDRLIHTTDQVLLEESLETLKSVFNLCF